jgi:hypothetical protein
MELTWHRNLNLVDRTNKQADVKACVRAGALVNKEDTHSSRISVRLPRGVAPKLKGEVRGKEGCLGWRRSEEGRTCWSLGKEND